MIALPSRIVHRASALKSTIYTLSMSVCDFTLLVCILTSILLSFARKRGKEGRFEKGGLLRVCVWRFMGFDSGSRNPPPRGGIYQVPMPAEVGGDYSPRTGMDSCCKKGRFSHILFQRFVRGRGAGAVFSC